MGAQVKSDVGAPSMADGVAPADEVESEWDIVSQASRESSSPAILQAGLAAPAATW
ncbi:hypothetical protein QFZ88_005885 [Mesorhizobium sp. YL-MeA3-2017]|nr:hypothetical protein [Mesorhizobium sp. YL-MeA3-2017]